MRSPGGGASPGLGVNLTMEAEKGTPKLRLTRSEVSPNTILPRFAELAPKLRRRFAELSTYACFTERSSDTLAEVTSEASPNSAPKRRRTQLRYFAEVTSEASPN